MTWDHDDIWQNNQPTKIMETKTEQQPVNERAARLAELTERAKRVAEEIHKEVCAVNPYADNQPYIGISKMYNAPNINVSVGEFDVSCETVGDALTKLQAFNPDADKDREIADLEAKLAEARRAKQAKLKGVAA